MAFNRLGTKPSEKFQQELMMRQFDRAVDHAFVLEQRVAALISQLAELEVLRARVREGERMVLHRQTIAAIRSNSIRLPLWEFH